MSARRKWTFHVHTPVHTQFHIIYEIEWKMMCAQDMKMDDPIFCSTLSMLHFLTRFTNFSICFIKIYESNKMIASKALFWFIQYCFLFYVFFFLFYLDVIWTLAYLLKNKHSNVKYLFVCSAITFMRNDYMLRHSFLTESTKKTSNKLLTKL